MFHSIKDLKHDFILKAIHYQSVLMENVYHIFLKLYLLILVFFQHFFYR